MLLLLLHPGTVSANSRGAEIGVDGTTGGVHDFTKSLVVFGDESESRGTPPDNCRVCHTPRNREAASNADTGVLWNERASTRSSWQLYGSDPAMLSWIDGRTEPAPTGSSKVCLSCHDGVAAANHSDGRTVRSGASIGGTSAGLTNNHPISISYAWTRDSQLHNPAYAVMGDGRSVRDLLEDGRVECATCHDVHSRDIIGNKAMLRTATSGADVSGSGASDLCLVCHDK